MSKGYCSNGHKYIPGSFYTFPSVSGRVCKVCRAAEKRRHYLKCRAEGRKFPSQAAKHARLRSRVINEYGGRCACCGEDEPRFLTIDHIFNDGSKDLGGKPIKLLYKLQRLGYPKDRYRVLCCNCNMGRQYAGGVCPHMSGRLDRIKRDYLNFGV
jgi:hypothetical protein